jgi:mono/diheme cytochrome c family protein
LLAGCAQENTGDQAVTGATVPVGIERFLLFPNPVVEPGGGFETDTAPYASAYYAAIDPGNQKDTLAKWKAANGFGGAGEERLAVFRDARDLGYGRRMTGRRNLDGSIAFFVDNYAVTALPNQEYPTVNVEAAAAQDAKWHIGTNAIEWSCAPLAPGEDPATCRKFAKFFNFSATTGARQLTVDLDRRGQKAMPGPCLVCHGGRADPLTPPDPGSGRPRFALLNNSVTGKRGDTQAKLQPFNADAFEWSSAPGFTRAEQEATIKIFNQWVLCTYPLPGGGGTGVDACRQTAAPSEWEGTAAAMIHAWYGGTGMPNAQLSDTYLPTGWVGFETLYREVIAPYCSTCHIVRGAGLGNPQINIGQKDIDFSAEASFRSYAERTKVHVFDRGAMPLAELVYAEFWESSAPALLASYLDSVLGAGTATSSGGPLRPGRPLAGPGPNRMVRAGASATLSGADSLFATTYSWTIAASPPGGDAVIGNPGSQTASFLANVAGDYTVRLTVTNGAQSHSKAAVLTVSSTFPDPASIRYAQVLDMLRNIVNDNNLLCADCHLPGGRPNNPPINPSIAFTAIDRDGDGAVTATDEEWLLKELRGRVNLTEIGASPLLLRPTGSHHGRANNLALPTGAARYSQLYHWIVNGMPSN